MEPFSIFIPSHQKLYYVNFVEGSDEEEQKTVDSDDETDSEEEKCDGSAGDLVAARCLAKVGVFPEDTRDGEEGGERFHPFQPHVHLSYQKSTADWYSQYSVGLREGQQCCSNESLTFGGFATAQMRDLHAFLHTPNCWREVPGDGTHV